MRGIVLLSGGIDSSVLLALARTECDTVQALTILYGQKHEREVEAAAAVAAYYRVPHLVQRIPNVFGGFGSTLIDKDKPQPHLTYEEIRQHEGPSPTYVPFRNANLLSMATTIALVKGLNYVYAGMHADDHHHWAYPDCGPEFVGSMAAAIYVGTYHKVQLRTPFLWRTKAQIVALGAKLGVPFEKTYSCYEGRERHCAKCPTCVSRQNAFSQAGVPDPTLYEA